MPKPPLDPMGLSIEKTDSQPHRTAPCQADIDKLEKVAWDANVEHVVIWYRDRIGQLRERVRETERALKLASPAAPERTEEQP